MSTAKRASIRAIDQGTCYDVPGSLKALAREIERGDHGRITDVGIVLKGFKHSKLHMDVKHVGTGTAGDLLLMSSFLQNKASR